MREVLFIWTLPVDTIVLTKGCPESSISFDDVMLRAVCASEPNQPGWLASPYLGLIIFVHVLLVCGLLYVALAPACLPAFCSALTPPARPRQAAKAPTALPTPVFLAGLNRRHHRTPSRRVASSQFLFLG